MIISCIISVQQKNNHQIWSRNSGIIGVSSWPPVKVTLVLRVQTHFSYCYGPQKRFINHSFESSFQALSESTEKICLFGLQQVEKSIKVRLPSYRNRGTDQSITRRAKPSANSESSTKISLETFSIIFLHAPHERR